MEKQIYVKQSPDSFVAQDNYYNSSGVDICVYPQVDHETKVLADIVALLISLDQSAIERVVTYLSDRFG